MKRLRRLLVAALALLAGHAYSPAQAAKPRPNVLFVSIDDLNHWVGYLGRNKQIRTPNLDRVAQRGVRFTRAYCAAPVCNPSRAALMSGLRPSTSGVYDNPTDWRPLLPENLMLTTQFRKAGYFVAGAGKIYHDSFRRDSEWDGYMTKDGTDPIPTGNDGVGGIKFAPVDARDEDLRDYRITNWIIDQLGRKHDRPFFLAAGLHKPHMPWFVPRKYFDMYPLDKVELPPVLDSDLEDVPRVGAQMARPHGDHAEIVKSGRWKEAVQGYMAAISYTDMNFGRLIDALDRSPHRDNTIIVVWGDHGWHLGEKLHWRKFALWEESTRAPLFWIVPGVTMRGGVSDRTVDFMSIYPTLLELCGITIPGHVEGASIRSLLVNPAANWNHPALTTFRFGNHSVRSEKWRYTRYNDGGEELYDETKDPLEWTNLAGRPEYASVKSELARHLPKSNAPSPSEVGPGRGRRANPQAPLERE